MSKDRGNPPSPNFQTYTVESIPLLLGVQVTFQRKVIETVLLAIIWRGVGGGGTHGGREREEKLGSSFLCGPKFNYLKVCAVFRTLHLCFMRT